MDGEKKILDVIDDIYAAATDPVRMNQLGAAIAREFNTDSSIIYLCQKPNPSLEFERLLSTTDNFDSWACNAYGEYYHQRDEWFSRGSKKPLPAIVIGQELIEDRQFSRTEFCADWCERIGFFHVLGTAFQVDSVVGAIGIHKSRRADEFTESDRQKMRILLPHLQRAFQIHRRLDFAELGRSIGFDLIDNLSLGVIIVGADSRLIFANQIAERTLKNGAALTISHGQVYSTDARYKATLARTIASAADTSSGKGFSAGGVVPLPRSGGETLVALVSPLRSETAGYGRERPAALIVFSDPDARSSVSAETLASVFGLTPAESRLVVSLLAGETLSSYAELNALSLNTAKTHLQQIFQKTGYSRQIDLVRAILNNPVLKLGNGLK